MNLKEILKVGGRRKGFLIAIPLIAVLITAILTKYMITPTYQASTTLILTRNEGSVTTSEYQSVLLNMQLVKTYQHLAKSRGILEQVINEASSDLNVEMLKKMVTVQFIPETELLTVKTESPDPTEAALIANTLSMELQKKVSLLTKTNTIEILEWAQKPLKPSKPNLKNNIFTAVLLGFLLSFTLIFTLETLNNKIYSSKDITEKLGLPILGAIPKTEGKPLVTHEFPRSITAEAFRVLRTNIVFSSVDKPVKTLLVTSSVPQEGKSTVTANLGIAFAQKGNTVLIIDADLRLPKQHKVFEVELTPGLTDVMMNEKSLEYVLKTTKIPGLFLLTIGHLPPNPAELLGSEKMQSLIEEAKKLADIIIIDSPPVVTVIDAAILANQVDGTILVAYSGKSKTEICEKALEQIRHSGARILGAVLNGLIIKGKDYYYYDEDKKKPK